jgi:hypothetical protein
MAALDMYSPGVRRGTLIEASALYLLLWIPALLLAGFISYIACLVIGHAPMWSALSYLLALPAVLVGLKSFRTSAIATVVLFVWDVVTTTWPHVTLAGFLGSTIDVLLLVATGLVVLITAFSPFASVLAFMRHLWAHRGD